MRLFIGIEPGPTVTSAAAALIAELKRRVGRLAPHARITWVADERLHITVRFIGSVDDADADALRAALAPALDIPAFNLTISELGTFPVRGAPRVIWAGAAADGDVLERLDAAVTARLARVAIAADSRPFRPHLTLARVREAGGLTSSRLLDGLERTSLGTTQVGAITLFESRLSPQGPAYVALQRTALSA